MQFCFDATKFGCGLKEAVELSSGKGISAVDFTFEPFAASAKSGDKLSKDEQKYLKEVRSSCEQGAVTVSCLNIGYCLQLGDKNATKKLLAMAGKLTRVAGLLNCSRLGVSIEANGSDHWKDAALAVLSQVTAISDEAGVKTLLRLSTPPFRQGVSLAHWRPLQPQDWRDILAALPQMSLSFSPADCLWQGIDYLQILPNFVPAIEHIEARDIEINREIIADSGLFGPLWWRYRIPGKGQVDWRQLIEALKLYGYNGALSVHLDDEFVNALELEKALDSCKQFLQPLVRD